MPFSWVTSSAIEFQSNGVKVMADLSKATKRLAADVKALQATVDAAVESLDAFSLSAIRATDAVVDLNAATGKANTATSRSVTRVTRAAAAYDAMAASAARAATAVETVQTAQPRLGRGGSGAGGGAFSVLGMLPGPLGILGRVGSVANALTGGGLGHLAEGGTAIDALYEAGHFQTALQTLANITGATAKQMDAIRQTMFNVGNTAAMSPLQTTVMAREVARNVQGTPVTLDALLHTLLPDIAKMQVVLKQTRGMAPLDTADAATAFVHLFRAYKPEQMKPLFDLSTRAFEMTPATPPQFVKQLSYFETTAKNLGIPDAESLAIMIAMTRGGFKQGKGATGVDALLRQSLGPLQVTSFQQGVKEGYLSQLGLESYKNASTALGLRSQQGQPLFMKDGHPDAFALLDKLSAYETKNGVVAAQRMFTSVFGVAGSRIAAFFANPEQLKMLKNVKTDLTHQKSLGLNSQFSNLMNQFDPQILRVWNNFQALMTELGWVALPGATKALKDLGGSLHDAQAWLHAHKDLEKQWADNIMGTVKNVEGYLVTHKADLLAIGTDFANLGGGLFELGKISALTIGPLTTVARVLADIATLNVPDLLKMLQGARAKIRDYHLPTTGQSTGNAPPPTVHQHIVHQHFAPGVHSPQTVGQAAFAGIKAAYPQAALGRAGAHHTSAMIPNPRTVSMEHGAH